MSEENPNQEIKSDVDILWWNSSEKRDYYLRPVAIGAVSESCSDKWDEGWRMVDDASKPCEEFMHEYFMHSFVCMSDVTACCANLQIKGEDAASSSANKWENGMCVRPWLNNGVFPAYDPSTEPSQENTWKTEACHGKTADECKQDPCNYLMDPKLFPSLHRMDVFEQRQADELAGALKDDFDSSTNTFNNPLTCVEQDRTTWGGMGFLNERQKINFFDRQTPADMLPTCHAYGIAVDFQGQANAGIQYKRFDAQDSGAAWTPQMGSIPNVLDTIRSKAQQCLMPVNQSPEHGKCQASGNGYTYNGGDNLTFIDLAKIWLDVTKNFKFTPNGNMADRNGGVTSCAEAVAVAAGECHHPAAGVQDIDTTPICSSANVWQVSAGGVFATMASCSDVNNPCCSAAAAYAHSIVEGQQLVISSNTHPEYSFKDVDADTTVPFSYNQNWLADGSEVPVKGFNPVQENGQFVNRVDTKIDQRLETLKRGSFMIPKCSHDENPWVKMYKEYVDPNAEFDTHSVYTQQEPCFMGPFGIWGEVEHYPGMPTYSAWGGAVEHYFTSKSGNIDTSNQSTNSQQEMDSWLEWMNNQQWDSKKTHYQLAQEACAAVQNQRRLFTV
jgi:hypothetical protein